jgi:hypothetical protein
MANSTTNDQASRGGALDIKGEHVARVGSDAELRASKSTAKGSQGEASVADAVQPVEKFDPPAPDGERRIFQNGDTDRTQ